VHGPAAGATIAVSCLVAVLLAAGDASACAVCYGDPDSSMTKAMAAGIWVLLGCIGFLLAGFGGLFLYWMQRSKRIQSLDMAIDGVTH
jgi:hypothetical protein